MPLRGFKWAIDPIAVQLPRTRVGQIDVPNHIGVLGHHIAACLLAVLGTVEKAQLHFNSVLTVQGEVDPSAIPRGTEWIGTSWPNAKFAHSSDP